MPDYCCSDHAGHANLHAVVLCMLTHAVPSFAYMRLEVLAASPMTSSTCGLSVTPVCNHASLMSRVKAAIIITVITVHTLPNDANVACIILQQLCRTCIVTPIFGAVTLACHHPYSVLRSGFNEQSACSATEIHADMHVTRLTVVHNHSNHTQ